MKYLWIKQIARHLFNFLRINKFLRLARVAIDVNYYPSTSLPDSDSSQEESKAGAISLDLSRKRVSFPL